MTCLSKIAIGATVAPIGLGALLLVVMGPVYVAAEFIGVNPGWGLPFSAMGAGALFAGLVCLAERFEP